MHAVYFCNDTNNWKILRKSSCMMGISQEHETVMCLYAYPMACLIRKYRKQQDERQRRTAAMTEERL